MKEMASKAPGGSSIELDDFSKKSYGGLVMLSRMAVFQNLSGHQVDSNDSEQSASLQDPSHMHAMVFHRNRERERERERATAKLEAVNLS